MADLGAALIACPDARCHDYLPVQKCPDGEPHRPHSHGDAFGGGGHCCGVRPKAAERAHGKSQTYCGEGGDHAEHAWMFGYERRWCIGSPPQAGARSKESPVAEPDWAATVATSHRHPVLHQFPRDFVCSLCGGQAWYGCFESDLFWCNEHRVPAQDCPIYTAARRQPKASIDE